MGHPVKAGYALRCNREAFVEELNKCVDMYAERIEEGVDYRDEWISIEWKRPGEGDDWWKRCTETKESPSLWKWLD